MGGFEREGLQVEVPDEVFEDAELKAESQQSGLVCLMEEMREGSHSHARQKVNS